MKADANFTEFLAATSRAWVARNCDDCVLSMALPTKVIDPLNHLPLLGHTNQFRFLWDGDTGFSLAASGKCQQLLLDGPRRFELAQRFSDVTFGRLLDVTPQAPSQILPRILFLFSFFDEVSDRKLDNEVPPAAQAILPIWQISNYKNTCWIRLNGIATNEADARDLAEKLWLKREILLKYQDENTFNSAKSITGFSRPNEWQNFYRKSVIRGIDLVNSDQLEKIVLAVRQSIWLDEPLDPLSILFSLRKQQPGSCRFLWQLNKKTSFFGASPERLLNLFGCHLLTDALAGTAHKDDKKQNLLKSEKDLREHELVVASIVHQLVDQGLKPFSQRSPDIARHGNIFHLHTPITALTNGQRPLELLDALHPTPAVAGLPRKDVLSWVRTLEPFERGNYAAPIGWVDSKGNADFRVAIRCGNLCNKRLDLTAGAGLVKGSKVDREMQEVELKLGVLASHLDLKSNYEPNLFNNSLTT